MPRDYGDETDARGDDLTRADETVLEYLLMYMRQHVAPLPEHRRQLMRHRLEAAIKLLLS